MWRRRLAATVALIGIAVADRHLRLTIPGLTVRWSVQSMLFKDGSLKLWSTSKPVKSVFFSQIGL